MNGFGRSAVALCILAGVVCGGVGQEPAPDTQTLRVTARLVVLDVTVTDSKGNFVSGLDKSQFTIIEDKKPQTIRSFEAPTVHEMPAGASGKCW